MWYEKIIAAHKAVTDSVSHFEKLKAERYFVWQEDGANDFLGDNSHSEGVITGTTDLFTRLEFDPWKEDMERSFDIFGIAWYLNSVQYEEDTGFTHYEWVWSVV